jgi:spore coat protein U-like protein
MATMNTRLLVGIAVAALIAAPTASRAATTATGNLLVSANVTSACSVNSGSGAMNFGNLVGSTISTLLSVSGNVSITCTTAVPWNVGLDKGVSGSSVTAREMTDGLSHFINYSLFSDVGHTTNWGQTVGMDTVTGTGLGVPQSLTVFGQIPAQNISTSGFYQDTVGVIVTY